MYLCTDIPISFSVPTKYTGAAPQKIVDAHNKYRRSVVPAASDMKTLVSKGISSGELGEKGGP